MIDFPALQQKHGLSNAVMALASRPETVDEITRAGYATVNHFRELDGAHNWPITYDVWTSTLAEDRGKCVWCGASRFDVRYGYTPPKCQKQPKGVNDPIDEILAREEQALDRMLVRGEKHIPELIAKHGLSGESLAHFHQTYGYEFDAIEAVAGVLPESLHAEYEAAYQTHKDLSRAARKVETIVAKTKDST